MQQTHFSLLVVSFATAMAVFFAAPIEPPIWISLVLWLAAAALLEFAGQRDAYWLMRVGLVLLVFALGFSWAQGRTHWRAAGTGAIYMPGPEQAVALRGTVDWSEPTPRGSRVDLAMQDYRGRPFFVRLYGKRFHAEALRPGCVAEVTARLRPLPLPIVIDGHDPRLRAWFSGQRARGFIKSIDQVECSAAMGWRHKIARGRLALATYYRSIMPSETGAVAAALVTGVRGMITADTRNAFRHSGLAHMLAISGLHMALFAGSVYALIRFLAALWPWLVLRHDIRKPAALIALLAATGYLIISGAGIATLRAYIKLAIFFLAILLERPAVTMRNVLWAALIVLLLQPQAIVQVGFQMSFAAVMALVAVYEAWRRNDRLFMRLDEMSPLRRMARLAWRYAAAPGVTSLIAGSVTGFIAITQFYQIGTYGLPANLLAMPFFGTLIMPMAPLSLLLWPLGGAWLATDIMHGGIAVVLAIAGWFTSFDSALWRAGASPDWVLPVAAVGFVFLCLVTSRWRLIGLAPILISALFLGEAQRPIAHLVGRDAITVRQEGGSLKLLRGNGLNYELGIMARYHGQDPDSMGNRLACAKGCGVRSGDRMVVAYLTHTARLSVACKTGDLVILPFHTARYPCKALLLDERSLQRGVPLQIDSNGRTLSIRQASRARMWQR